MAIYVVVSGDTIYSIAARFAVSAERIIRENQLANPDRLVIGQTLVITGSPLFPPTQKLGAISINGYAYPYIDRNVLRGALPSLTYLSPFSYGFTPEGDLVDIDDTQIIAMAREEGVAPLMVITPSSAEGAFSNILASVVLNNMEVQNKLLDQILVNLEEKNYEGLDIDFEYISAEDRDAYTAFVAHAVEMLRPLGYSVFVALAPKTSPDQPGLLYEGHDYYGIGRVADGVLIMTYEWGYTFAQIGYRCL